MIAVVDYGMGNLASVQKALERVGADARIIDNPRELTDARKIVLPGVGAFRDAIARLRQNGMADALTTAAAGGTPLLGICLGYQLLFDASYEDGEYAGLGILPGKVVRFDFSGMASPLRVPQMGWNQIHWAKDIPLYAGLPNDCHVYFAHSYYPQIDEPAIIATTTDYGVTYASSAWKGHIFGTQFHPEKSQLVGLKILENFVRL